MIGELLEHVVVLEIQNINYSQNNLYRNVSLKFLINCEPKYRYEINLTWKSQIDLTRSEKYKYVSLPEKIGTFQVFLNTPGILC